MKHPAPFPLKVIDGIASVLDVDTPLRVLDPFCGSGRIATVSEEWECFGVEIEEEWAAMAWANGVDCCVGDSAKCIPQLPGTFDAVVTSPCYGNRMADTYAPPPEKKHAMRRTYRIALGHDLSEGSAACMQWGEEYRDLHARVWARSVEKIKPGGWFVLNIKNHMRKGEEMPVTEWHIAELTHLGLYLRSAVCVPLKGDQNTNTMRSRGIRTIDCEWVIAFQKGEDE
jgi:tRNA G10  N-methylase Trm11